MGHVYVLLHGEMSKDTVYNDNPGEQAKQFQEAGCQWIHIVDLNGAFEGKSVNSDAIQSILEATSIPAQLGGGLRDLPSIENWINAGISRIILGTAAVNNPELVREACKEFPGKIAVGIDARNEYAAISGWAQDSEIKISDLALKMQDHGACTIIYTDITRDGALEGVNIDATLALADILEIPVIASGGVSSIKDIEKIKECKNKGIEGVICGRALYDGKINLKQAVDILSQGE